MGYYQEGDKYFLQAGLRVVQLGDKTKNIEDIQLEISRVFDIPLGGLKPITKKDSLP